jgi:hypothetical protein
MFLSLCMYLIFISAVLFSLATLKASSGKQRPLCSAGSALEGSPRQRPMAADDDMIVKAGPFELPNDGEHGTLTWADRQEILGLTGVSAAVRDRKQTHGKRHLTLSGPMSGMELAKKMAWQYVLNSQRQHTEFKETPGCEGDWVATHRKTAPSSSSSSSSTWQTTMPMQVFQQQHQAMMQQAAMHQQMMQQAAMQHQMMQPMFAHPGHLPCMPAMHGMMQQHPMEPMEPMFVNRIVQPDDDDEEDAAVEEVEEAGVIEAKLRSALGALLEKQRREQALTSPPATPATPAPRKVLATTSKAAAPAPPTVQIPAKAAPRTAVRKLLPPPPGLPPQDRNKTADITAQDADDEHDVDGPPSEASLAGRRTVSTNKKRRMISIRQDPTLQYVNIMSVGWRQQGVQFTPNFTDLIEGENGLIWRLKVRGIAEPDIVVDCRPLKRYDLDRSLLKHTGNHAEIVFHTVYHKLFKTTMRKAICDIQEVFDDGHGVNVLVVCTSGCHRSVSFALVMEYIMKEQLYHTRVSHLSDGSWRPRHLCMSCTLCSTGNPWKQDSFKRAPAIVLDEC